MSIGAQISHQLGIIDKLLETSESGLVERGGVERRNYLCSKNIQYTHYKKVIK